MEYYQSGFNDIYDCLKYILQIEAGNLVFGECRVLILSTIHLRAAAICEIFHVLVNGMDYSQSIVNIDKIVNNEEIGEQWVLSNIFETESQEIIPP